MQALTYSVKKSCEAHLNGFLEHLLLSVHMLRGGGYGGGGAGGLQKTSLDFKNSCSAIFQRRSLFVPPKRSTLLQLLERGWFGALRHHEAA